MNNFYQVRNVTVLLVVLTLVMSVAVIAADKKVTPKDYELTMSKIDEKAPTVQFATAVGLKLEAVPLEKKGHVTQALVVDAAKLKAYDITAKAGDKAGVVRIDKNIYQLRFAGKVSRTITVCLKKGVTEPKKITSTPAPKVTPKTTPTAAPKATPKATPKSK